MSRKLYFEAKFLVSRPPNARPRCERYRASVARVSPLLMVMHDRLTERLKAMPESIKQGVIEGLRLVLSLQEKLAGY